MVDLVGTCPMGDWDEWLAEGDAAGEPETGREYEWWTKHSFIRLARPGDRLYIVAHRKLRGFALVIRVERGCIVRGGGAVACTLGQPVPGFRGLRERWWHRADERLFPEWRTP